MSDNIVPYNPANFDEENIKKKTPEEIEAEAHEKAKEIYKEAFDKGYSDGLKKAEQEGKKLLDEGKKQIAEKCDRLESIINKLEVYRKDIVEQLLPDVINLSIEIASRIVRKEIELDRNIISYIAQETLSRVEERDETVTIRINPIDYDVIVEHMNRLKESSGLKNIVIEPDHTIEQGGCLLETNKGEIDARIDEQIKELSDAVSTATNRDM
ncbi:MAG: FliH/SctL family protein [Thermodesulfovibrionales bacterium]|nr:FliH/SctL family protein [Thermodesulfovibrionales bacterium]